MTRNLIILRGLPGSGKSTLAAVLSEDRYPVYSVDDYFTDQGGRYRFEYDKNHLAFDQCIMRTEESMKKGIEKIFLDNVFSMEWEMQPYFKLAVEYGYTLHIVTVENHHGSKNIHAISDEQMKKMAEKFKVTLL